jgi:hypothetical protein
MRGAVLHKLGLNVVKERLMRRHYGVKFNRLGFKPGKDPAHLKGYDLAGNVICKNAMRWYAHKVRQPEYRANPKASKDAQWRCEEILVRNKVHRGGIRSVWASRNERMSLPLRKRQRTRLR